MDPLTLIGDDINALKTACDQLFDQWNDSKSQQLKLKYVDEILKLCNSYKNEINIHMNVFMNAEKELMSFENDIKKSYKN